MSEEINESWDEPEKEVVICNAKKNAAKRILEYLDYSSIKAYGRDIDDDSVEIIVADVEAEKALQYVSSFLSEEKKRAYETSENDAEDDADNIYSIDDLESKEEVFEVNAKSHSYQTNTEKYNASMSSAYAFMAVGTGVLVIIALVYLNILNLPIRFSDNPMLSIMLPLIAVIFEVIAVVSWKQAQNYRSEIGTEEQFDKDLKEWFSNKYSAESIDALCSEKIQVADSNAVNLTHKTSDNVFNDNNTSAGDHADDNKIEGTADNDTSNNTSVPDEILFLQRLEAIEKILNDNYPDLDKGYVDVLSEELYQKLFDTND